MVSKLKKDSFEFSMCKFIAEVMKVNGSDYPGRTLYQLYIAIQKHLELNGVFWKLVDGPDFSKLCCCLDNVMKECAANNIGMVKRQAQVISYSFENKLWEDKKLGEEMPDQLRSTVLFLLGINIGLQAGDEHYNLCRLTSEHPSQLTFQMNDYGVKCLVYTEDTVTKANDGGLKSMRNEHKIVWVYPSSNVTCCPVCLVEKYMKLCPPITPNTKKFNFYLRSLEKYSPTQWYSEQVVGLNTIKKVIKKMLENAKLDGFFTNHSLRCSGTTRLFNEGIDRKLVKEFTSHRSDAVDAYQITSHEQREQMSKIISGVDKETEAKKQFKIVNVDGQMKEIKPCTKKTTPPTHSDVEIVMSENSGGKGMACSCGKQQVKVSETSQIGDVISQIVNANHRSKATIKIEIEFN